MLKFTKLKLHPSDDLHLDPDTPRPMSNRQSLFIVIAALGLISSPAGVCTVATPSELPNSAATTGTVAGTSLFETATDNKFNPSTYTVVAGQSYSLTMSNKGEAVHNWRLNDVKGSDGKDIAVPLTDGGKSATITLVISVPGTYHYLCDVHPDEMKGTLTVQ